MDSEWFPFVTWNNIFNRLFPNTFNHYDLDVRGLLLDPKMPRMWKANFA